MIIKQLAFLPFSEMAGSVAFLSTGHLTSLQSHVVRSKGRRPVNVPFLSQCLPSYRGNSTVVIEEAYEAAVMGTMSVRKGAKGIVCLGQPCMRR